MVTVFVDHSEDIWTIGIRAGTLGLGADISNIRKSKWEAQNDRQASETKLREKNILWVAQKALPTSYIGSNF